MRNDIARGLRDAVIQGKTKEDITYQLRKLDYMGVTEAYATIFEAHSLILKDIQTLVQEIKQHDTN